MVHLFSFLEHSKVSLCRNCTNVQKYKFLSLSKLLVSPSTKNRKRRYYWKNIKYDGKIYTGNSDTWKYSEQIIQRQKKSDQQYNYRNLQLNQSTNSTEIEFITEPPCDPHLWSTILVLRLVMDKYILDKNIEETWGHNANIAVSLLTSTDSLSTQPRL